MEKPQNGRSSPQDLDCSDSSSNTPLYLLPFIFWELREDASGDLAVATYASHPSP